ncbi:hypothetical protein SP40_82 [Salmonella phage 40]|nr:hypothetical protein SP40_82 [Salmonella phage 40]
MALVVCITKAVKDRPVKAVCETLIFEDEEMGRQYVKDHKTFVLSVEKVTRVIKYVNTGTEVQSW